jgi:YD repeat-containing protein
LSLSDRNANNQVYNRNTDGNVARIFDSVGRITNVTYNTVNHVVGIQNPAGRSTTFNYDSNGNLTSTINPAGFSTHYLYDSCGRLTQINDSKGYSWKFGYDINNRLAMITDPLSHQTQFTYLQGSTLVTYANGNSTTYRYDDLGRLTELVDANNHRTQFSWDSQNNPTRAVSPLGYATSLNWYGNTGLIASITDAQGNSTSYVYDANNNPSKITDARGNVTQFSYDANGANLLQLILRDGGKISFTYDAHGNPLTVTDPNGNAHDPSNPTGLSYKNSYNAYGLLTDLYDPLGNHWTYTWDNNASNLLSVLDAKGQLTQYTYDILDRLASVTYADLSSVHFTYDALGNLTSMRDNTGTTYYTYNAVGQLSTEDEPSTAGSIKYNYDKVGNLTTITRENGAVLAFNYDSSGQLISQTNPFDSGRLITYQYDADDRLVDISYPNGDMTSYSYYPNNWLKSLLTTSSDSIIYDQYNFPSQAQGGFDANGNPLIFTRTFASFDSQGNLDWTTETWNMTYDAMNRLTREDTYNATGVWRWRVSFAYNPNGLWNTRTYEDNSQSQSWNYLYDAAARWTGVSYWDGRHDTVTNDANGNQTKIQEQFNSESTSTVLPGFTSSLEDNLRAFPLLGPIPGQMPSSLNFETSIITNTTTLEYDAADRLVKVTDPMSNWFSFKYDGFNRTIQGNSNKFTSPKYQYYDMLGMARETQGDASVNYLYDLAGVIRSSTVQGSPSSYLHRDPRGQITHISDQLQCSYDYCPVGNVQAGSCASGETVYEPFLSKGLYAIGLEGTWQAGILFDVSGGHFWAHNAQLATQNSPIVFIDEFLKEESGFDPDDPCLQDPYSWECLRKHHLKTLKHQLSQIAEGLAHLAHYLIEENLRGKSYSTNQRVNLYEELHYNRILYLEYCRNDLQRCIKDIFGHWKEVKSYEDWVQWLVENEQ